MSTDIFPIGNISWSFTLTPNWSTKISSAVTGRETRLKWRTRPIWNMTLVYEVLKSDGNQDLQAILDFYNSMYGSYDTFLLNLGGITHVPEDNTATNRVLGTGDGYTSTFTLLRPRSPEPVGYTFLSGITSVKVDGAETSDYTVTSPNTLTFTTVPASGLSITASYFYYMNMRFSEDSNSFEEFAFNFWELKELKLQSVIP